MKSVHKSSSEISFLFLDSLLSICEKLIVSPRPPAFPYRLVYLGLGFLAVAAVVLGIAFGGGGEPIRLPSPIESLTPRPSDRVLSQAVLEVDLEPGYTARIFVDGFEIPATEIVFIEATGVHRWQPSVSSVIFDTWTPGNHTVRVSWDTLSGLPQPGEFIWTFRVQ